MTSSTIAKKTATKTGAKAKQHARAGGVGIDVSMQFRNRLLSDTWDFLFQRADDQISLMTQNSKGAAQVEVLTKLLSEREAALDKSIGQLSKIASSNGVALAMTGVTTEVKTVCLTPQGMSLVRIFRKTDEAMSWLHGLWIMSLVPEPEFKKQGHLLRSKLHAIGDAVSVAFKSFAAKPAVVDSKVGEVADSESVAAVTAN